MRWFLSLMLIGFISSFGQLPNKTLQTSCNTVVDDLATQLGSKQASYLLSKGYYFQGVSVTAIVPADGATVVPDKNVKPTNATQTDTWTTATITLPASIPCNVTITYYSGPKGKGYTVNGVVIDSGETYYRSVNVGPETDRDHDWSKIVSTIPK